MENVIDIPGTEVSLGQAANSVVAQAKQAMEAKQSTPGTVAMTPMEMVGRALEMGVSAEILKQMMDLRDREEARNAKLAFNSAIALAKAELKPVVKNAKGHNDKRYADFAAYANAVDPIITKYGLSYRFKPSQTDRVTITCILSHELGHAEETTLSGPIDTTGNKNAIQAIGSTLTYLQRYSLVMALGLAAENDDDGKAAGAKNEDFISPEQVKVLQFLIDETNTDIEQFCQLGKIGSLPEMRASQYENALRNLNTRKAKMAQRVAS